MNNKNRKSLKHILPMSLCCLIPILLLLAVPMIASFTPKGALLISSIAPFICPIFMGAMLFFMFKSGSSSTCCDKKSTNSEK